MARICWLCNNPVRSGDETWILPKNEELGDPELVVLIHNDCKGFGALSEPIVVVPDPADMGKENFRLHFNKRHDDSLGGLAELGDNFDANLWWRFHRRLHEIRIDFDHAHAERQS